MDTRQQAFQSLIGPLVASASFGVLAGFAAIAHHSEHVGHTESFGALILYALVTFVLTTLGCFLVFGVLPWGIQQVLSHGRPS
jgi:ABC-type dipeptide/oligopeptide/nickel transport system permease component